MAQSGRNNLYALDPALEAQLTLSSFEESRILAGELTHLTHLTL